MIQNTPDSTTYVEPLERERPVVTVLTVGLDDQSRDSIRDVLAGQGASTEIVEEATAAASFDRIESTDVDCIVSAQELPETTGLDFLRELRDATDETPFVLYPARGDERLAGEAINAGADGYFQSGDSSADHYASLADRIETVVDEYRTRETLVETSRLLMRLTEYTNDAFWMFTDDWSETVIINSAYDTVWDRSMKDLVADPADFLDGVHPEDRDIVTDGMEILSGGETTDLEYRVTTDDGLRWVNVHAEPVFDATGSIEYVAGFTRDVTELKDRELSMQSLNTAATELLEARDQSEVAEIVTEIAEMEIGCPLTVVRTIDADGDELVPLAATESVLDRTRVDALADLGSFTAGNTVYDLFRRGDTKLIEGDDELAELTPPGTTISSMLVVPLADHGVMTVGTSAENPLDEFDRHLLEILGRTATAALNRVQRDKELESYRKELEQSNRNLQQFAHTASHDLQEPLRMVSSYVDLLDTEYGDELDGEAEEYMEFAVDGAHRMQDMINALLQYARVQTRAQEFEETDAGTVLDETLDALQLQISETDADVSTEPLPMVQADPDQLGQVFQNLIKNALTYADESGVDPRLEIGATEADGVVTFSVTDNGPGIDEADWQDIFDIFKRNGSHDAEGTGIGLAVCQRIVRRHDGEIWVASGDRDGATFKFTIPVAGTEISGDD